MCTERAQRQHVWRENAHVLWFTSSHSARVNRMPIISRLCCIYSILKHNPKNLTEMGTGGIASLKRSRQRGRRVSFAAAFQGSGSPIAADQVPSVSSCSFRLTSMTLSPRTIRFCTTLLPFKALCLQLPFKSKTTLR